MLRTLILDFDGSVGPMEGADAIPLGELQEAIRFSCRISMLRRLQADLEPRLRADPPVVFMGSGDYHHVSYMLIERLRRLNTRIQVLVFDNHPDNMRYPFGIHCGSWVWHVSRLPFVARVHVVGITSTDVERLHVIENHLAPLRSGRVVYWCVGRNLAALRLLGVRESQSFVSVADMLARLGATLSDTREPVYLSIDKDVLARDVVQTNWDQGVMRLEQLTSAIQMLQGRIVASDVVGDVSSYRYRSRVKRFLSFIDGQPQIPNHNLSEWQADHHQVNRLLLSLLSRGVDYLGKH
jgi:arginase family enzyme